MKAVKYEDYTRNITSAKEVITLLTNDTTKTKKDLYIETEKRKIAEKKLFEERKNKTVEYAGGNDSDFSKFISQKLHESMNAVNEDFKSHTSQSLEEYYKSL